VLEAGSATAANAPYILYILYSARSAYNGYVTGNLLLTYVIYLDDISNSLIHDWLFNYSIETEVVKQNNGGSERFRII
jgi:hypothetical protein